MSEQIRDFEFEVDLAAVKRIWREIGWVDSAEGVAQLDDFFACGRSRVALLNGEAECCVHTVPGTFNLGGTCLDLCAVTAVTTSRVARGQAFAKQLTAEQLLYAKAQGAAIAALGMFDQGFYDLLGFGTGAYDHEISFDPSLLQVDHRVRSPQRFSPDDAEALHAAMLNRAPAHGGVCLAPWQMFRAELGFRQASFGLGYRGANDQISHFLWLAPDGEHGPYRVLMTAYQNTDQLIELLGLLKSLADQVYSVKMMEPPEIQLQSLLQKPMRHRALTKSSAHMNDIQSLAWWQARILNLESTVQALSFLPGAVEFGLILRDPLDDFSNGSELGLTGEYVVKLGADGSVQTGVKTGLPVLEASVNALTRLFIGVAPASSLSVTDDFSAPQELLRALDDFIRLPRPVPGLEF